MESIQVVTADGVSLAGVHVPPDGDRSHVGFVLCHGFTVSTRKPAVRRIAARLARHGGVVAADFRGHGRSAGRTSAGDLEVLDVDAAVGLARRLGYRRVVTVGFSMGGSVVLRHAAGSPTAAGRAPEQAVDAVASVSAPARWYVRDTVAMRRVHWLLQSRSGRLVSAAVLRTRIGQQWVVDPESPVEVVGRIPPTPLLVVHGDGDAFLGVEHGRELAAAAGPGAELWEVPGFGHAEGGATPGLVDRIARWALAATPVDGPGAPGTRAGTVDP